MIKSNILSSQLTAFLFFALPFLKLFAVDQFYSKYLFCDI